MKLLCILIHILIAVNGKIHRNEHRIVTKDVPGEEVLLLYFEPVRSNAYLDSHRSAIVSLMDEYKEFLENKLRIEVKHVYDEVLFGFAIKVDWQGRMLKIIKALCDTGTTELKSSCIQEGLLRVLNNHKQTYLRNLGLTLLLEPDQQVTSQSQATLL